MNSNKGCWARIDKDKGHLNTTLNVFFDENETVYPRSVKIRVFNEEEGIEKIFTLVQKRRDNIYYENGEISAEFEKQGCNPETEKGEKVVYTVPAGKYISKISQKDADRQAEMDIEANGQNYANSNGGCTTILWYNNEQSKRFIKNDCNSDTEQGSEVAFVVPERSFSSTVSQEDADNKALAEIDKRGQDYANENGECSTVKWYNSEASKEFQRNNCAVTEEGSKVIYTVPAGRYSSTISQQDADLKAQEDINSNGQEYVNTTGICSTIIWYNQRKSKTFQKNDCPEGQIGESYEYVVEAGKYSSDISQADADQKALDDISKNGQAQANLNAGCVKDPNYFIGVASKEFTRNNCEEHYHGTEVTVTQDDVEGGPFVSRTSQDEANALALVAINEQGQAIANIEGTCIEDEKWVGKYSKEFTKNNCIENGVGSKVTIDQDDVTGGPFISYESQSAANMLARAAVEAQGQALANTKGECTWIGKYSEEFQKNDCERPELGTKVIVTQDHVVGRPFISHISQDDADSKAETAVKKQGQAIANSQGGCLEGILYIGEYSKEFTPECEECHHADPVLVDQNDVGGPFASYESQEDANRKAQEAVEAYGQAFANKNGNCVEDSREPVWESVTPKETRCNEGKSEIKQKDTNPCSSSYNEERWVLGGGKTCEWTGVYSETFKRNNCPEPDSGTEVEVDQDDVTGGPFISWVSQDDANNKAKEAVKAQGQGVANSKGKCQFVGKYSKNFTKNNCGTCQHGVEMTVTQDMVGGPFYSLISQDDANNKAKEAVESQGQVYVNKNGSCELDDTTPRWEDVVPEELRCNEGRSEKKQQDKNPCSGTYEDFRWVAGGDKVCTWTGIYSKQFTKQCADGGVGSKVTIDQDDVTGGPFTSTVSQADANNKAKAAVEAQGQALANSRGTCTWTGTYSKSFTKNDCGTCKTGSSVNVNQDMVGGPFTSTVSKADANTKAKAAVEAQGQAVANKNGSCVDADKTPKWVDTGSTQCSGCTSQKQQRDTNQCSDTYNTTRWISGGSRDCSENGSWGSWDYYCSGYDRWRRRSNTCGAEEDELYESNSYDCGYDPCDPTYYATSDYRCSNGKSQRRYHSECYGDDWRGEGTACTATVNCSDKNTSGSEGSCTWKQTCSGTQTASGSTTSAAQSAAYAKCSCSKTYTRSYDRAASNSECNSRCPNGGTSNGTHIQASGTGSSCSAADSAATSAFVSKLDSNYTAYCNCNQPPQEGTVTLRVIGTYCGTNGYADCRASLDDGTSLSRGTNKVKAGSYYVSSAEALCKLSSGGTAPQWHSCHTEPSSFSLQPGGSITITLTSAE